MGGPGSGRKKGFSQARKNTNAMNSAKNWKKNGDATSTNRASRKVQLKGIAKTRVATKKRKMSA